LKATQNISEIIDNEDHKRIIYWSQMY